MNTEKRYAAIDVGSNSVRYMEEGRPDVLTVTTRLGSGLADTGRLAEATMARSVRVIAAMANNARRAGYTPVAYATSAVRDAENRAEFLERVYEASGVMPEVLSGEREAEYAFRAATDGKGGLIDIGGGSMQLVTAFFRRSYPIGCVRGRDIALASAGKTDCDDDFPAQRAAVGAYIDGLVSGPGALPEKGSMLPLTGVGGSITTLGALCLDLGAFDKSRVHGSVIGRERLEDVIGVLSALGEKRREHPLLRVRHDVILYGAAILAKAMDLMEIPSLTVSTRDGLDGYIAAVRAGAAGPGAHADTIKQTIPNGE